MSAEIEALARAIERLPRLRLDQVLWNAEECGMVPGERTERRRLSWPRAESGAMTVQTITIADVRRMKEVMRANAIPPRRITTKAMARRFRRADAARGIASKWRIGDEYYLLWELAGQRAVAP